MGKKRSVPPRPGLRGWLALAALALLVLAAVLIWRTAGYPGGAAEGETPLFSFSLNDRPVFENGAAEGPLLLVSNPGNPGNLQFIIRRDDTGAILYDSQMLAPDTHVEQDALQTKKPLPAGEYPCTATVLLLDAQTYERLGQLETAVTIVIQN